MRFNSLAVCLVASLIGVASPLFAGDQPDSDFKLPRYTSYSILHNYGLYAPAPDPAPVPPSPAPTPAPQSGGKQLTTAGTVLKWVGVGLMGEGGLDVIVGIATPGARGPWIGTGCVIAGVGAVLYEVGIHKTQ